MTIAPALSRLLTRARSSLERRRPTVRVREWVLRGLGLVHLMALGSAWVQREALIGERGILPAGEFLQYARAQGYGFGELPTLLWWWPTDVVLTALFVVGFAAALALVGGLIPRAALLVLFAVYLSLTSVGQAFFQFQWDALLLEGTLLAAVWAPWAWTLARGRESSDLGVVLLRFLVARLMFASGAAKLLSGDPTWRELTAMQFHYWTQPLPNPLSPWMHALPGWLHQASVAVMLGTELGASLLVFGPRMARRAACAALIALQLGIAATGNYGFFNWLSIVLCLSLLDDDALEWIRRGGRATAAPGERPGLRPPPGVVQAIVIAVLLWGGAAAFLNGLGAIRVTLPLRELGWANHYALFAVMTTTRDEISLEGSDDGVTWRPYVFRYQPGPLDRTPPLVFPGHMPRADWLMWFAAFGECGHAPWLLALQRELLRGNPTVGALFEENPFRDRPPRMLRTLRAPYRFAPLGADAVWTRGPAEPFCPILGLKDERLIRL